MNENIEVYRMKEEPDVIYVNIEGIPGTVSLTDGHTLLRLDKVQADRLAFQIGSMLQEMERK